jgi:hypothetical protein
MTDDKKISNIITKADAILKEHGGVYLERRLFNALKSEFPELSRADFKEVLDDLLEQDYVMERGLIKPQIGKEPKESKKHAGGKRTGKGTSDTQRIPDKRL